MNEIKCEYTDEITCPYCWYKDWDSWEENDYLSNWNYEKLTCWQCSEEFLCQMDITVDYSTKKIN